MKSKTKMYTKYNKKGLSKCFNNGQQRNERHCDLSKNTK